MGLLRDHVDGRSAVMLCRSGNPKGLSIPAGHDFDGIYPTAPIFMSKIRNSSRELLGEWSQQRQASEGEEVSGGRVMPARGAQAPGRCHFLLTSAP